MGDLDNLNLPKSIGRYQVLTLLGAGAMGVVVMAEDPRIKRKVAIKLMKQDSIKTEADQHEYLARFQREAEVSGLLNHPGIVAIYDVGEAEDFGPFLAMEYVQGKPLDSLIKGGPTLTLKEKLRIAVGLADALDHAHAKGIVHRDVKPGNVMVGQDGRPKLMDFGIAKREDASLTQTGTFLGTPSYASPEQIREGVVDNRSDIFSFGVLTFELMSGQSPFPGSSINTILYRIVNEAPVEVLPPVLGLLPDGWSRVFGKVLAKKPDARYGTCTAFVRDLLDAVADLPKEDRHEILGLLRMSADAPVAEPAATTFDGTIAMPRPATRKARWPWMAALALVGLAGGGWFVFNGSGGTRLQIESLPTGAKVFVNDATAGTTPLNRRMAAGDKVRLELKGHQPIPYEFKPGEAPPSPFRFEPIIKDEVLTTLPPGATVVLDEKLQEGVTPLKLRWNQGLAHRLTLTKGKLAHHEDFGPGEAPGSRIFELKEGTTAATRPEPPLDPNAPGALKLAGGFSVRVKVDGKDYGEQAPGARLSLPQGSHKVELSSPRYYFKDQKSLTLSPGQTATLSVPGLANLSVETFPGAGKVYIDGQDAGIDSDGSSVQVAHGKHTVVVRAGAKVKSEIVDLTGDKPLKFPL